VIAFASVAALFVIYWIYNDNFSKEAQLAHKEKEFFTKIGEVSKQTTWHSLKKINLQRD